MNGANMQDVSAAAVRAVFKLLAAAAPALLLGACVSSGEDLEGPSLALAQRAEFRMPAAAAQVPAFSAEQVVSRWWEGLGDEQLRGLVETALVHNHDAGIALANLNAARAVWRDASLGRRPRIEAGVEGGDQRLSESAVAGPAAGGRFDLYEAGFDASWELDLFGRIAHEEAAALAMLEAGAAELDHVHVTVAAEVGRAYLSLRGAQHRLDVNLRHAENLQQSYRLTQDLREGGFGDALDVQRALALLEQVNADTPALRAEIDIHLNRLAVLTGGMTEALRDRLRAPSALPSVPPVIGIGDPAALLQRRPDIRRAERELAAAVARYDVTVSELYPRVTISGSIGYLATTFADLGSGGTLGHFIGPRISWEAFDRDRLHARVDAADARVQGRMQAFEQALLLSFEDVENALAALRWEGERHARLLAAAEASAQALALARDRFDAGADSFLDVLDAQRTSLGAEERLADSEVALALNLVSLYKALGGGWGEAE